MLQLNNISTFATSISPKMRKILFSTILYFLIGVNFTCAQKATLTGRVVTAKDGTPVEYASILLNESGLWAVTDQQGLFTIHHISPGKVTLIVRCLGYASYTQLLDIKGNYQNLRIPLQASNLKLNEVQVVARRKENESTTSYTIGRQALDNQQILNLSDVTALLPGGKTVNSTLIDNNRIGLRSQSNEMGNSSFGTAIEVDGVRINNNAEMGETRLSCKSPWIGANQLPKDFGYPEHEERDILYTSYLRSEALHLRVQ